MDGTKLETYRVQFWAYIPAASKPEAIATVRRLIERRDENVLTTAGIIPEGY